MQERQAGDQEGAEAGAAAAVRVRDQERDRSPRGWLQMEEVWAESSQEQPFPKVIDNRLLVFRVCFLASYFWFYVYKRMGKLWFLIDTVFLTGIQIPYMHIVYVKPLLSVWPTVLHIHCSFRFLVKNTFLRTVKRNVLFWCIDLLGLLIPDKNTRKHTHIVWHTLFFARV